MATLDPRDREKVYDLLDGEVLPPMEVSDSESSVLMGGRVEGKLMAGNLEVLRSLCGNALYAQSERLHPRT